MNFLSTPRNECHHAWPSAASQLWYWHKVFPIHRRGREGERDKDLVTQGRCSCPTLLFRLRGQRGCCEHNKDMIKTQEMKLNPTKGKAKGMRVTSAGDSRAWCGAGPQSCQPSPDSPGWGIESSELCPGCLKSPSSPAPRLPSHVLKNILGKLLSASIMQFSHWKYRLCLKRN